MKKNGLATERQEGVEDMHTVSHGSLRDEKQRPMPGDHLVPNPIGMLTNGVTIKASPASAWPWIVQIGSGRAGWYSYDWIDNGGHASATAILPEHQQLAPGEIVPAIPGMTDAFCVAAVETPVHLILTVPDAKGGIQVSYEFLLVQLDHDHTRLIVRGRLSDRWPTATQVSPASSHSPIFIERVYTVLARSPQLLKLAIAYLGHHLMESRMLRGIKRRAEKTRLVAEDALAL